MKDFENLCMACMNKNEGETICPNCGYNKNEEQEPPYLPKGKTLDGRYIVGKAIDKNSEGIGYIGYDTVTETTVYIREFLPIEICSRGEDNITVEVISHLKNDYNNYLNSFLRTFRAIARMKEISPVVPIYNIFLANNTAYTVSEWIEGITLTEYIGRNGGRISWSDAKVLFFPIISAMSELNRVGIYHWGISPENLIVTRGGKIKLIGFAIKEIRMSDSRLTPQLYSGCSAVEQYISGYKADGTTDIYGLTASLFYALTGELPNNALNRRKDDSLLIPNTILKSIPSHVVIAMANALRVYQHNRTATFKRLRDELSLAPNIVAEKEMMSRRTNISMEEKEEQFEKKNKKKSLIIAVTSFIVSITALIIFAVIWLVGSSFGNNAVNSDISENSVEEIVSEVSQLSSDDMYSPNLVGMDYKEAQKLASEKGDYTILVQSKSFSDEVKEGRIISQVPEPDKIMRKGSAIVVIVSQGPKLRALPEIQGMTLSEASLTLSSAGFSPIKTENYSDTIDEGLVIGYSNNNVGDMLEYGSQVEIVISKGR